MDKKLKIMSLGGFGNVTQNLFVYEQEGNILVVDCGVGFIEEGKKAELIVPDISYLVQNQEKIRGIVLTHGHEDHTAGLPFLLPRLKRNIPLFASRLTAGLVEEKLEEYNLSYKINLIDSGDRLNLGPFSLEFVYITHSIPDTFHIIIRTPLGIIYHGGDFKFDWTPVMGRQTEVGKIAQVGQEGVTLLLSDSLRSEKGGYTPSEQMVEESFEREAKDCRGRFFVTTMSSNVSRWQQAINVAASHQRKVALVGRSVKKVANIAARLGYLHLPSGIIIPIKKTKYLRPNEVAFLVSGSQAQAGSALDKIASGEDREIEVKAGDKVVFSADYIPGNELAIHRLIDKLSWLGADVSYSEISDDIHVSVLPDTEVFIKEKGKIKLQKISELTSEVKVPAFNSQNLKIKWTKATPIKHHYKGKIFRLFTKSGRNVAVTQGHSLFALKNGEICQVKGEEIKIGDHLVIPKSLPSDSLKEIRIRDHLKSWSNNYQEKEGKIFYNSQPICPSVIKLDSEFCRLLGYYLAEGSSPRHISLVFGKHEKDLIQDARNLIRKYFKCKVYIREASHSCELTFGARILQKVFREWFGSGARNKRIPAFIFSAPRKAKLGFLAGYLAGDGTLEKREEYFRFRIKTASCKLASDILYLLSQLSLCGRFDHIEVVPERRVGRQVLKKSSCWVLRLQGREFFIKLLPHLPLKFKVKVEIFLKERKRGGHKYSPEALPIQEINLPKEVIPQNGTNLYYLCQSILQNQLQQFYINPILIKRDAKIIHNPLSKIIEGDLLFDPVKKIKVEFYEDEVWDLSVPGAENFVGGFGGIVLHNSGHGSQADLALLIGLSQPQYLLPIGGAFRQMKQYALLAQRMGYPAQNILLPAKNQTIQMLPGGQLRLGPKISLHPKIVV
jgi:mRNA degradation ribonuclease J1/J2/intein/homing endonuclease